MFKKGIDVGRYLVIGVMALMLSGCFAPSHGPYWAVAPSYDVRNSPIPVPRPSMKPMPPQRYAVTTPSRNKAVVRSRQPSTDTVRWVRVERGDTVYGLAGRYDVPLEKLVAMNGLNAPYLLHVGQRLRLPQQHRHKVRRGDTVFSIAQRYDVEVKRLASANRLTAPYLLHVGDQLTIPSGRSEEMEVASRPSRTLPNPPRRTAGGFDWPVTGTILSSFGPKEAGLRNDGINIGAPLGAPVRAADAGVVAYAGSGIRGFGNLILIRHSGDWVTAYAHNNEMLVKRGDTVRRGDMVARVGKTGSVSTPQLHFEVRRGAKAVDPSDVLPRLSAFR